MLLFLRGSNAGHDATRRASPFSRSKHTALPAVLPSLGQVSMDLLTQTTSGPPPLPQTAQGQVPLEHLVKPKSV